MRKMQKPPAEEPRKKKRDPLAEGLRITVPTTGRGRSWSKLSDEQLLEYARRLMVEKRINGKKELQNEDKGLYSILHRRKLISKIKFDEKMRSWTGMSDEEIVELAREVMKENKISGKSELGKIDYALYAILKDRGLLDEVGFEEKLKAWQEMDDQEIIEHARKFMKEKGIKGRRELGNADPGLYAILYRRELLDEIGFTQKKRFWKKTSNEELIELARRVMEEHRITYRSEFSSADPGLYGALRKRGLLGDIEFEEKIRSWKDKTDEELIELTRKIMEEKKITGKTELDRAYHALFNHLKMRGLLDRVGFEQKQRSWKHMTDDEIVEYARGVIEENKITVRRKLHSIDGGLSAILQRRGLLNRAFARAEQKKEEQARDAVIGALEAFAANDNDSAEDDVA